MTQEKIIKQLVSKLIHKDYTDTVFTSQLYEMFGKHSEAIIAYIKKGREFWHYDGEKRKFRKLKITYVRTGVMFFVFEDEPEKEHAWFIGSINCMSLYAAQIYPQEISRLLFKYCPYITVDFQEICKYCKWYDCDGRISVKVIWDN